MAMRHEPGRSQAQACLIPAAVCLASADAAVCAAVLAARTGAAVAALSGLSAACAVASAPALVYAVIEDARSDAHVHAIVAWTGLRLAGGLLLLPCLWAAALARRAGALLLALNGVRTVLALGLLVCGAKLASRGPKGDMPGRLQWGTVFALLVFLLLLLPEAAAVVAAGGPRAAYGSRPADDGDGAGGITTAPPRATIGGWAT
eukprot:PRCOL_00002943-RA